MADSPLQGQVALVAGATRGAGRAIAVELARAGAFVYATGRSSRTFGRSEIDRPETIEDTGELMAAAGGAGLALRVDHLEPEGVSALVSRIEAERKRLDILVNDIFGGDRYAQFDAKLWEHDIAGGLRMLEMGVHTHLITAAKALPLLLQGGRGLLVEMTDGTHEYNRAYREGVGFYYDLVKANVERILIGLTADVRDTSVNAVAVTPGWLRSEAMLDHFGVTEETWQEACARVKGFEVSESPTYVARGVAAMAADPDVSRLRGQVLTAHQLAMAYGVTDVDGSRPDCWGYITPAVRSMSRTTADRGVDVALGTRVRSAPPGGEPSGRARGHTGLVRAAVRTRYGGPDVVRFDDVPESFPKRREILVQVHATTVNRTDCAYRSGQTWINRAFCGWPRPRVHVLGSEYAGIVVGIGEEVTSYAVGDPVFGFVDGRPGAHAELVAVAVDGLVAPVPEGWDLADAAPGMEGAH